MKKNTVIIIVAVVVIAIAAYFLFFRKKNAGTGDVSESNVKWIIDNFNAKQINHVYTFWQWVLWVREGNMDWYDESSSSKSKETVLEEFRTKLTFPGFISWCTGEEHLRADPNRQVISAAQAQAVKNHGINENEWEEAYRRTFDSLL